MATDMEINKALLDDIYAIYSQAETEMLDKVAKRVAKGITTEGWNERKLAEVQVLRSDIQKAISGKLYEGQGLISEDIVSAYTRGKIGATIDAGKKAKGVSSIDVSGITNRRLKKDIQTAFDYAKGMAGLPQDPDSVFKKVVYATGTMEKKMIRDNAGAMVQGDTIYICKPFEKNIDDGFIMHEIGHKVTKFGSKVTHASMSRQAEELAKKLGYKNVKQMSAWVSSYAMKNSAEFYSEVIMMYYESLRDGKPLTGNKKKIVEAAMEQMYNDPAKKAAIRKESIKFAKGVHTSILDQLDIPMNLKQLILATNKLLNNASFQILRNAEDAYTQIMANATTGLLAGTDTRIQASQKMLNEMAANGITSFVDKAGRKWSLSSYAEMCARTVSAHAALQGHIDRQLEVGEDLVRVSRIGTTCPICQRWQGVVLSISGKSPKYHGIEIARADGLFHPNCKHTIGMFIPELDGEGQAEPNVVDPTSHSFKQNKAIEKQRANERKIRYWKDRAAVSLTPEERAKSIEKVKYWQHVNLLHCHDHELVRQYAREKTYTGNALGPTGAPIGGSLPEYEEFYKKVVGADPRAAYRESKKIYGYKEMTFDKWLRDEIDTLDEIDIDRAYMKDASRKDITPTSLYKKYIGDAPMADYAAVSPYEKGTKEFKSHYAKWLKTQIDEIGVSYKVKPKYVEVHEDIPFEDTKLSATEIYKKYHDGKAPTAAYKELGGEEGTGMKYGKWVETEKKRLIKEGITKTVPFSSVAVEKTAKVIATATETIEKAKKFVDDPEIEEYRERIKLFTDPKTISSKMRRLSDDIADATGRKKELLKAKYEVLKEHDLEVLREKVKTAKPGHSSGDIDYELDWLKTHVLDKASIPEEVKAHVRKKYNIWAERKAEYDIEWARKQEEELRKKKEEARKKRIIDDIKRTVEDSKLSNEEVLMLKDAVDKKDPDRATKRKAFDDIIKEREKAAEERRRQEELRRLAEERRKKLEEMGVLPRDPGASILDSLSDYYKTQKSAQADANDTIKHIARDLGKSEVEVKQMIDDDLKAIFVECELGARMKKSVLKKVLSDDPDVAGFKNLFEVGTGGGCTDFDARSRGENTVFGYSGDNKKYYNNEKDRPFYGMMMPRYDYSDKAKQYYTNGPGRWYGDGITLVFDKALMSNISFTIGDSLDYRGDVVGCEATNPEFRGSHYSFKQDYAMARGFGEVDPNDVLMKIAKSGDHYLELQYHGHQTKQDMVNFISHVYIEGKYPDIESLLTKKGIPFTVI